MDVLELDIPGLKIVTPKIFGDERGFFLESYNAQKYHGCGIDVTFVQDNLSYSSRGVLRGLHFQNPGSQGKLVSVLQGAVYDVAVDIRLGSPTFGQWYGIELRSESKKQFWIPAGFAHGFVVISETALFSYKCDAYYQPQHEFSLAWNDPELGIEWPISSPALSPKDQKARRLRDFAKHELPSYFSGA